MLKAKSRRLAEASETLSGETLETKLPELRTVVTCDTTDGIAREVRNQLRRFVSEHFPESVGVRKCSHEGCTTSPPPDSWVCPDHVRRPLPDNIGKDLEPLVIAVGFGLDVHGSRLGEPRNGRTDHDYRAALLAAARAIDLLA